MSTYLLAACTARFSTPPAERRARCGLGLGPACGPWSAKRANPPRNISRKDEIWAGPAGVLAVAGGKLTAYRKMAETHRRPGGDGAGSKAVEVEGSRHDAPGRRRR